ncbi:MAG: D-aminoacyl-tRNA deacylase [Bacillota bacterium]
MKALIQRVKNASVSVDKKEIGKIKDGLLVFLGIAENDNKEDADYLVDKIINLRIFEDENAKMNLSALKENKDILVVSQFTLYGDCTKGRRPSFNQAASAGKAEKLYNYFVKEISKTDLNIETGEFKAMMEVDLVNDGPVTFMLKSEDNRED